MLQLGQPVLLTGCLLWRIRGKQSLSKRVSPPPSITSALSFHRRMPRLPSATCFSYPHSITKNTNRYKLTSWSIGSIRSTDLRAMSSRTIFEPESNERPISKKQQLPNDKPWDGEESVSDSVLRMIMDKYSKPLRVEGAAKRNLPQPQTYSPNVQGLYEEENTMSSGEKAIARDKSMRSNRQKRIIHAREAALDYSLEQKYPSEPKQNDDAVEELRPKSITEIGLLAEERIREARAKGLFDDLPGRGKPIPVDVNESNPFVDRTEYFLNRIVQRQGAAPPWIMMQQEVDTEMTKFRSQLERSIRLYVPNQSIASAGLREWRQNNETFYTKLLEKLNSRVRSYNVMCPSSVRKGRLHLDDEIQEVYCRIT